MGHEQEGEWKKKWEQKEIEEKRTMGGRKRDEQECERDKKKRKREGDNQEINWRGQRWVEVGGRERDGNQAWEAG